MSENRLSSIDLFVRRTTAVFIAEHYTGRKLMEVQGNDSLFVENTSGIPDR